jgi:hypothetical protein
MSTFIWIVSLIAVVAVATFATRFVAAWFQLRGTRVLVCPETNAPVGAELELGKAAFAVALGQEPILHLSDCTRWPERAGCDQSCLQQLDGAPAACKLRSILDDWYQRRSCAFCRKPFTHINWTDHEPALLTPELQTIEWREIDPAGVDEVLKTHLPVCWNCHVAESFRREHPELVTDRDARPRAAGIEQHH